jgi:hypothetical protein
MLSITPLADLQTACHMRLLDSHGPISSERGFNFESDATAILYEPCKAAYEH